MSAFTHAPARSPAGSDCTRNARDTRHSRDTRSSRKPNGTRVRPPARPLLPLGPNNSTACGIAAHSTGAAAAGSIPREPGTVGGSGGAALAPPEH
jgi:hypothetical protein